MCPGSCVCVFEMKTSGSRPVLTWRRLVLWGTLLLAVKTILYMVTRDLRVMVAKVDQVELFRYVDFESHEKMFYKEQLKVGIQSTHAYWAQSS